MYKVLYHYSLLVFVFIEDDPEAPTRRTEALCWLAQGKNPRNTISFYFFAISFDTRNKIYLTLIKKQLTGLFILLLRYPKITSKIRMIYYLEELKVIRSYVQ